MRRIAPNYAFLAAAGFALIAFAASLTTIVEQGIKADVRASVVVDTYKAWHKEQRVGRVPYTVDRRVDGVRGRHRIPMTSPSPQRRRAPPDYGARLEHHEPESGTR